MSSEKYFTVGSAKWTPEATESSNDPNIEVQITQSYVGSDGGMTVTFRITEYDFSWSPQDVL